MAPIAMRWRPLMLQGATHFLASKFNPRIAVTTPAKRIYSGRETSAALSSDRLVFCSEPLGKQERSGNERQGATRRAKDNNSVSYSSVRAAAKSARASKRHTSMIRRAKSRVAWVTPRLSK
jgi:hypothetical protein